MAKLRFGLLLLCVVFLLSQCLASTAGPLLPTAATGNTNAIGGGTVAWTSPLNITANDSVFAHCLPGTAVTDDLRGGGFGFTIPSTDTITGIQLDVAANSPGTTSVEKFNTVVLEGGGGASANRAAGLLTPALTLFSFGGPADLWGTTWTPAQINAGGFVGNVTFVSTGGGPGSIQVDYMQITVTSTSATSSMGRRVIRTQTRRIRIGAQGGRLLAGLVAR